MLIQIFTAISFAYDEKCFPDLAVPTGIEARSLEAGIAHRFFRAPAAGFPDNFITGANACLMLRYALSSDLEIGASYLFIPKQYTLHTGYTIRVRPLFVNLQPYISYFGVQPDYDQRWRNGVLYQLNLQSEPLLRMITASLDAAYDGYGKKYGIGMGVDIDLLENIALLGEYYPVIGERDTTFFGAEKVNCFIFGIKISTYGHHFIITFGNTADMGIRRLMRGTENNSLRFGFNLERQFSF